jgi:hypothetical protein
MSYRLITIIGVALAYGVASGLYLRMLMLAVPASIVIAIALIWLDRKQATRTSAILYTTSIGAANGFLLATTMFPPDITVVYFGAVLGFLAGRFLYCRINWFLGSLTGGLIVCAVTLDAIDRQHNWGRGGLFEIALLGFGIMGVLAGSLFCNCQDGKATSVSTPSGDAGQIQ